MCMRHTKTHVGAPTKSILQGNLRYVVCCGWGRSYFVSKSKYLMERNHAERQMPRGSDHFFSRKYRTVPTGRGASNRRQVSVRWFGCLYFLPQPSSWFDSFCAPVRLSPACARNFGIVSSFCFKNVGIVTNFCLPKGHPRDSFWLARPL